MTVQTEETAAIRWYRTVLPRETLNALNTRSDARGLLQACGTLALLGGTGASTLWAAFAGHFGLAMPLLFLHGMVGTFNINAVHELCHHTVFRSRWLNALFVRVFGFIGWNDWVWFSASHANHHRYTLHPPRDGEVVLPIRWLSRKVFWKSSFWAPLGPYHAVRNTWRKARGRIDDAWSKVLFPEDKPEARRALMNWNRSVLVGHGLILLAAVIAAVVTRRWAWLLVPYVVSFSFTYGGWLFFLCNNTQHVGLMDKVPDFRLCCRSMRLPAWVSFLYWHMQYHTEHHMYAAVPCYNLRRLNRLIAHDLPSPKGVIGTWREIGMILRRQEKEPAYQYQHPFPATATPPVFGDRVREVAAGAVSGDAAASCRDL